MTFPTDLMSPFGEETIHRTLLPLAVGVLLIALGGCDAVEVHTADTPKTSPVSGLEIEAEALNEANLYFDSGPISDGEAFSIELIDDQHSEPVARVTHEGTDGKEKLVKTDFSSLQPTSVTVECRNNGTVLYSQKTDLGSGLVSPKDDNEGGEQSENLSSGQEPNSYHYYDNGETVLVGVDYESQSSKSKEPGSAAVQFSSSSEEVQCTHIYFTLDGVSDSFSADGILFSGKTDQLRFAEKELR